MRDLTVPKSKPVACDTWEVRATLAAADAESVRIPMDFPKPYLIVGCLPTIVQTSNAGDGSLLVPSTDDILVLMDMDNQRRFTQSDFVEGQQTGSGIEAQYVTLSSLDTQFRDLYIELTSPKPVLGFSFRWRVGTTIAADLYEDISIGLAFFCLPLEGR